MYENEKATMTVEETAEYLNIGRSLCYRMIKENKIPYIKFATRIVVPKAKLEEFLRQ
ncbi:MAG: helix-turn-helix domain-containing protein [Lachnospiraceae bacterium]|nr:helix-turn-helix domain-containing protein [Lachnospiraceae bacterium]